MRKIIAVLLVTSVVTSACASASRTPVATGPQPGTIDPTIQEYVQRLAAGSKVRVERVDGATIRGTLMKATPDAIVVQKNTRIPEPPIDVPLARVARVTVDGSGGMSTGKAIGIGMAAGAGALLAFFAILAATLND